jgi:hypothetical protein
MLFERGMECGYRLQIGMVQEILIDETLGDQVLVRKGMLGDGGRDVDVHCLKC